MSVLRVLITLLIPMGAFPVLVAIVLGRHVNSASAALKERARLSLLLALLGLVVSFMAANHILEMGMAMVWLWFAFVILLLLIDIACGIWLLIYLRGGFRSD